MRDFRRPTLPERRNIRVPTAGGIVILVIIAVLGVFLLVKPGNADDDANTTVVNPKVATATEIPIPTATPGGRRAETSSTQVASSTSSNSSGSVPTATPRAGSSNTERNTSTLPDRKTCAEIRGTQYRSTAEMNFFRANCITTQSTGAAATKPPAPSAQSARPDTCYDRYHGITAGTQVTIPAMGCNIVGNVDLLIGSTFVRQYDDLPHTGSFTPCTNGCTVMARETINATNKSIDELNNSPASSCGPGCKFTYPQVVPAPTVPAPPPDTCYDRYHGIAAGTQITIPAMGCNIVGNIDLQMADGSFKRQYDDLPHTGSFTPCTNGCTFIARETVNATNKSIDELNNSPASSCGPGCKFTYPQVVPN